MTIRLSLHHLFRLVLFAAVLAVVLLWFAPHLAFADDGSLGDPLAPIDASDTLASIHVSALLVNGIISSFIPLVVAWFSKVTDNAVIRHLAEAVLAALSAGIVQSQLSDGTVLLSQQTVLVWVGGMVSAALAYAKYWKPAGLTSSAILIPGGPNGSVVSVPGKLAFRGPRKG